MRQFNDLAREPRRQHWGHSTKLLELGSWNSPSYLLASLVCARGAKPSQSPDNVASRGARKHKLPRRRMAQLHLLTTDLHVLSRAPREIHLAYWNLGRQTEPVRSYCTMRDDGLIATRRDRFRDCSRSREMSSVLALHGERIDATHDSNELASPMEAGQSLIDRGATPERKQLLRRDELPPAPASSPLENLGAQYLGHMSEV